MLCFPSTLALQCWHISSNGELFPSGVTPSLGGQCQLLEMSPFEELPQPAFMGHPVNSPHGPHTSWEGGRAGIIPFYRYGN